MSLDLFIFEKREEIKNFSRCPKLSRRVFSIRRGQRL